MNECIPSPLMLRNARKPGKYVHWGELSVGMKYEYTRGDCVFGPFEICLYFLA